VDDAPFGGGAGMIMKIEPLYRAVRDIKKKTSGKTRVFLLTARGEKWSQKKARYCAELDDVILICGRYEGFDERIWEFVDAGVSIGDYILTGGEIPAMVVVDSVSRLLPGALGNIESLAEESHSDDYLEYPQYTRPQKFSAEGEDHEVPEVLLSGDHAKIKKWRENNKKRIK
jgi:tRNA (guanine37-N1)-methyltransferase